MLGVEFELGPWKGNNTPLRTDLMKQRFRTINKSVQRAVRTTVCFNTLAAAMNMNSSTSL